MTEMKTKSLLLLALLMLAGTAGAANVQMLEADDSPGRAAPTRQAESQGHEAPYANYHSEPNFALGGPSSAELSNQELFFKMMLSVLLVVVLGIAAIYISRKLLPKITTLPGKKIRIIESAALGQRQRVHLIEVQNHRLLIGSANDSITMLTEIGTPAGDFADELEKVEVQKQ